VVSAPTYSAYSHQFRIVCVFRDPAAIGSVPSEVMSTIESMNSRLLCIEKLGAGLSLEGKVTYELVDDANQRTASTEERLLVALEACTNRIGLLENKVVTPPFDVVCSRVTLNSMDDPPAEPLLFHCRSPLSCNGPTT